MVKWPRWRTGAALEGESVSLAGLGVFPPGGLHDAHSGPQGLLMVLKALGLLKGFTPERRRKSELPSF